MLQQRVGPTRRSTWPFLTSVVMPDSCLLMPESIVATMWWARVEQEK